MRGLFVAALLWGVSLSPSGASAHLGLDAPASRYGPEELKPGPCGLAGGARTSNVTYYEPGETIEVRWNEYVDHPGHYRIAFDDDGDDDFVDPATMMELYSNETVLLDGIEDEGGGDYVVMVTLPDVECDNCTLQVIQMMYDKPPYTTPGNDIYYQCADLVLRAGGAPDGGTTPDAGTPDAGTMDGGAGGMAGSGGDPGPRTGEVSGGEGGGCSAAGAREGRLGFGTILLVFVAARLARRRRLPV